MVQFLSIIFFSWISSIFVGFFKSSFFLCHPVFVRKSKKEQAVLTNSSSEADINYIRSVQAFDVLLSPINLQYVSCVPTRKLFSSRSITFCTPREQKNPLRRGAGSRGWGIDSRQNRGRFLQKKNAKVNLYFVQKKMYFASVIIFTLIIYSTQSFNFRVFHVRPFEMQAMSVV